MCVCVFAGEPSLPEVAPVQARRLPAERPGGDDPAPPGHTTPVAQSPRPAAQTCRAWRGRHAGQEQGFPSTSHAPKVFQLSVICAPVGTSGLTCRNVAKDSLLRALRTSAQIQRSVRTQEQMMQQSLSLFCAPLINTVSSV